MTTRTEQPTPATRTTGGRPLLSACLIVRDEEGTLSRCLDSLRGVADEIVVHDTGSTDATVAIAEAAGATVLRGGWDDDFAAARNTALAACEGEWIIHLDADDVFVGNHRALRRALAATPRSVDAYLLDIENLMDDGTGESYENRACRIFRRTRGRWHGRIHEQVVDAELGTALAVSTHALPGRLRHTGYLQAELARQEKVERNLRIAILATEEAGPSARPEQLLDLGRSLKAAGRLDEAAARCLDAAAMDASPAVAAAALHFAVSCLLGLGRVAEARAAIDRMRPISVRQGIPDLLEAQADLQEGRPERTLELLDGIDELVDDQGKRLGAGVLPLHRGMAFAALRRWRESADALTDAVIRHRSVRGNLGLLIDALARANRPVADLAAILDADVVPAVLDEVPRLTPDEANIACRGLWERLGADPRVVSVITAVGPTLGIELALDWSIRLREAGIAEGCPLLIMAHDRARPPSLRVYAGAAAVALGDPAGMDAIADAAALVPEAMFTGILTELNDLAPGTLPTFVESAACTPLRGLHIGQALHALGAEEEGICVVEASAAATDDAELATVMATWLTSVTPGVTHRLAGAGQRSQ